MNSKSRLRIILPLLLATVLPASAQGAEQSTKAMVTAFYKMVFYDHKVAQAFKTYVGATYKQHNPLVTDGIEPSVALLSKRLETKQQELNEIERQRPRTRDRRYFPR